MGGDRARDPRVEHFGQSGGAPDTLLIPITPRSQEPPEFDLTLADGVLLVDELLLVVTKECE